MMMTRLTPLFLSMILLGGSITSVSQENTCKETPAGKCFSVRGRYSIYTDGDAIWMIGTHRRLSAVSNEFDHMIEQRGQYWDHSIYGNFTVCPLTRYQPGHRQDVCIKSYKNIKVGSYR